MAVNWQWDGLVAQNTPLAYSPLAALKEKLPGLRVVDIIHDTDEDWSLFSAALDASDWIEQRVVISEGGRRRLIDMAVDDDRIRLIRNGVRPATVQAGAAGPRPGAVQNRLRRAAHRAEAALAASRYRQGTAARATRRTVRVRRRRGRPSAVGIALEDSVGPATAALPVAGPRRADYRGARRRGGADRHLQRGGPAARDSRSAGDGSPGHQLSGGRHRRSGAARLRHPGG